MEHYQKSTAVDVNPNYIKPAGFQRRLMKIADEYGLTKAKITTR